MAVVQIFKEVTGVELDVDREIGAIIPFHRDDGWENFEFRQVIEWGWHDSREREWLSKPGQCNLRTLLNPSRRQRLNDIVSDLKRIAIAKDRSRLGPENIEIGQLKTTEVKCSACSGTLLIQHLKIKDTDMPKGYRWQSMYEGEMERHRCENLYPAGWKDLSQEQKKIEIEQMKKIGLDGLWMRAQSRSKKSSLA